MNRSAAITAFRAAFVAAALVFAGNVSAVVLVDQSGSAGGYGLNSNADGSAGSNGQQIADNFSPASSASPTSIDWWGSYHDNNTSPGSIDFLLRLFSDGAGLPGAMIFEQTVSATGVDTGADNSLGDSILAYSASLSGAPSLLSSSTYWVSVLEDDNSTGAVWTWSFGSPSDIVGIGERSDDSDSWVGFSSQTMRFTLSAVPATAPEPGTLALLALGLAGLRSGRRAPR